MTAHNSHCEGRMIHDADSHITETRGWLESYCSDYVKKHLDPGIIPLDMPELDPFMAMADARLAGKSPEMTEELKSNLFGSPGKRNLWAAYGAVNKKSAATHWTLPAFHANWCFLALLRLVFRAHRTSRWFTGAARL